MSEPFGQEDLVSIPQKVQCCQLKRTGLLFGLWDVWYARALQDEWHRITRSV